MLDAYLSGLCLRCNRPRPDCQRVIDNGGRCSIKTTEWMPIGKHGGHRVWMRTIDGDLIYTVMREGVRPTEGAGGYFSIASALRVRGMEAIL